MERRRLFLTARMVCATILVWAGTVAAQYGGGSGTADDPYLIYTPEQLNAIGADPNDWDKHFQLRADLDLSAYTGSEFNLIGREMTNRRRGLYGGETIPVYFSGVFDGNGHTITNFTFAAGNKFAVGLFRQVADPNAVIRNLGLIEPHVDGQECSGVGALVGHLASGTMTGCYVAGGVVRGSTDVGGLVGLCNGNVVDCSATATVVGDFWVGGLAGQGETILRSYADGIVVGGDFVGGLVGAGDVLVNCYARGAVVGNDYIGGLTGDADAVSYCYAAASVTGMSHTGGLIGGYWSNEVPDGYYDTTVASFWDVPISGQTVSAGGEGKTTTQMQWPTTFLAWNQGDNAGVWTLDVGNDYPRLAWENRPGIALGSVTLGDLVDGSGTVDDPYLIQTAAQLDAIGQFPDQWDKQYRLTGDIDLSGYTGDDFHPIGSSVSPFSGTFDGDGHVIANFTYAREGERAEQIYCGTLFAYVASGASQSDTPDGPSIRNLGLIRPHVTGGPCVGALVGFLVSGTIADCYVTGGIVSGDGYAVGGLVGYAELGGTIERCYADTTVVALDSAGGLVGGGFATVTDCYAQGTVMAGMFAGGLIGNDYGGTLTHCYATGAVLGGAGSGGLTGVYSETIGSFWDVQTSRQTTSHGGVGLTTAEMQTAAPFLEAGWDFVGETVNGTEDIWWIDEGQDYPRLAWESEL